MGRLSAPSLSQTLATLTGATLIFADVRAFAHAQFRVGVSLRRLDPMGGSGANRSVTSDADTALA